MEEPKTTGTGMESWWDSSICVSALDLTNNFLFSRLPTVQDNEKNLKKKTK